MTWLHVSLILGALSSVIICAHSDTCIAALPSITQLATVVISGALGHAGTRHKTTKPKADNVQ